MAKLPTTLDLFKAGAHFGHRKDRCHPKMKPYIYTIRNTVHIIDLEKTVERLKKALEFITKTVAEGGTILFLGTKPQARDIIKKYARELNIPYVAQRWLGGTFTNFSVVSQKIKKLEKLEKEKKEGEWGKYTKKETLNLERELDKLKKVVGGIRELTGLPQAIYIVDLGQEKTAVREARRKNIPIVAIVDTNTNPELADFPIPANDDGIKSIEFITGLVAEAAKEGQRTKAKGVEVKENKNKK